jgi:hypothetical protein
VRHSDPQPVAGGLIDNDAAIGLILRLDDYVCPCTNGCRACDPPDPHQGETP